MPSRYQYDILCAQECQVLALLLMWICLNDEDHFASSANQTSGHSTALGERQETMKVARRRELRNLSLMQRLPALAKQKVSHPSPA